MDYADDGLPLGGCASVAGSEELVDYDAEEMHE